MLKIVLVGIGGFMGAILRYYLSTYIQKLAQSSGFPMGTLVVNLTGCITIGLLSRIDEIKDFFSPELRLILFMGFLGAFTTFSTFGNETIQLIQAKRFDFAIINLLTHVVMGLLAVLAGRFMIDILLCHVTSPLNK
ncbi:MAG: fluoride efflux transporter CrcB [Desulfamplus sp.]|nr:fluoride efflux transporter CrcB [Desulfamplus sp.]